MWPAIWPLAMKDLGKFTKVGASFLVMAIVGGAVVPLIFGTIVDAVKTTEVRCCSQLPDCLLGDGSLLFIHPVFCRFRT